MCHSMFKLHLNQRWRFHSILYRRILSGSRFGLPRPVLHQVKTRVTMDIDKDRERCNSETFWREVAPRAHVVQLYEREEALLSLLE